VPTTPLGEFLRLRRAAVRPEAVGLPGTGLRRVPGLRRDEVAQLAGVSIDYYVRLEQGRERGPSAQVLETLSGALRLDSDGRDHLYRLAGLAPLLRPTGAAEDVDDGLADLLNAWPDTPALVYNLAYDVLAANPLGTALYDGFPFSRNLMHLVFSDPGAREFYADWPAVAASSVAGFRLQCGRAPGDPRLRALLTELLTSKDFAELWARHDARGKSLELKTFCHRQVGPLTLRAQTFEVRGGSGQELVVYRAEPGSPSADALSRLMPVNVSSHAGQQ
jgi:transcriptional regulator with XRE-family HTH domain